MLYWIIGIFVSFFCIYAFISYIVFKFFVDRSVPKDMIFKGKDEDENENSLKRVSLPFDIQEVSIESINGLQLHSYFITNNASNKWIICVHGYSGNAFNLFPHINHFYSQGYKTFLLLICVLTAKVMANTMVCHTWMLKIFFYGLIGYRQKHRMQKSHFSVYLLGVQVFLWLLQILKQVILNVF